MTQLTEVDVSLDNDGFMVEMLEWNRGIAEELARRNDLGPLGDAHWQIIEFVRDFYSKHNQSPPIVKIAQGTGMSSKDICTLFPCGVARGAYRLAGLPRPAGCL